LLRPGDVPDEQLDHILNEIKNLSVGAIRNTKPLKLRRERSAKRFQLHDTGLRIGKTKIMDSEP
jgi:hypothetical protein